RAREPREAARASRDRAGRLPAVSDRLGLDGRVDSVLPGILEEHSPDEQLSPVVEADDLTVETGAQALSARQREDAGHVHDRRGAAALGLDELPLSLSRPDAPS